MWEFKRLFYNIVDNVFFFAFCSFLLFLFYLKKTNTYLKINYVDRDHFSVVTELDILEIYF